MPRACLGVEYLAVVGRHTHAGASDADGIGGPQLVQSRVSPLNSRNLLTDHSSCFLKISITSPEASIVIRGTGRSGIVGW
jgi:hypothetical protein